MSSKHWRDAQEVIPKYGYEGSTYSPPLLIVITIDIAKIIKTAYYDFTLDLFVHTLVDTRIRWAPEQVDKWMYQADLL